MEFTLSNTERKRLVRPAQRIVQAYKLKRTPLNDLSKPGISRSSPIHARLIKIQNGKK